MESGPDGGADQGSLMMRLRNHNPGGPPPTNGKSNSQFHNFSESLLKRHRFQMHGSYIYIQEHGLEI